MPFSTTTYKGRITEVYLGTVGTDAKIGGLTGWEYEFTMGEIDVTELGDTTRQWETDIGDGRITLTGFLKPGDTAQLELLQAIDAGTGKTLNIYMEGTAAATHDHFTGTGIVPVSYRTSAAIDGKVPVSISCRGALTLTAGSA